MTETPMVTVCVPVHDDPTSLDRLLRAIDDVDWPAEHLNVIVAVDGGDRRCVDVAERRGATAVVLPERCGSYAARNAALEQLPTETAIVAFTDADCIPTKGWLRGHADALRNVEMSGGAIDVTLRPKASPAEFVDRIRHLHQELYVTRDGYAATANLAVRREVVDAMQFDDQLQTGGDVEYCHRATAAGFGLAYSPAAVVEHPARQTVKELFTKVRRIESGIYARPERWNGREVPVRPRPRRALVRIAREQQASRGPLWEAQVVLLEYLAARRIHRAVVDIKRKGLAS